jgi:hypothetical protein
MNTNGTLGLDDTSTAAKVKQRLEQAIMARHGRLKDFELLDDPEVASVVARQIVTIAESKLNDYAVLVDYDMSHKKQVKACRFDSFIHDAPCPKHDPTSHLCPVPTGKVLQRIKLVNLPRPSTMDEVIVEMDRRQCRPAISHETLAFVAARPGVLREFTLVGLGSLWKCAHIPDYVLCLYETSDKKPRKILGHDSVDQKWPSGCFFPAVLRS